MKTINFTRLATDLVTVPWQMVPAHHSLFLDAVQALTPELIDRYTERALEKKAATLGRGFRGDVHLSDSGKHAVMNVSGPLYSNVPDWAKELFGLSDLQDINADVENLHRDPRVESVVFNLDTPGGMARPSSETAELIREMGKDKRTVAYSGPGAMMCSAGYKLGAACHEIRASDSADVGCIGTYIAMVDDSANWEQEGYRLELIRDGKYKAMGHRGKPVTDDERSLLTDEVDGLSRHFKSFVRENRPGISEAAMEGQTLSGRAAKEAGLIDGTRRNLGLIVADEIRRSALS